MPNFSKLIKLASEAAKATEATSAAKALAESKALLSKPRAGVWDGKKPHDIWKAEQDAKLEAELTSKREAGKQTFLEPSAEKRRMYHGSTNPNITEFKTAKTIKNEKYPDNTIEPWATDNRDAVFVSPEPEFSGKYSGGEYEMSDPFGQLAPTTYPVHVQVKSPFDFENKDHRAAVKDMYKEMYPIVKTEGYVPSSESMRLHDFNKKVDELETRQSNWPVIESSYFQDILKALGHDSFYVSENGAKNLGDYDPKRIKSAIGNEGTYDITNPDINKKKGGAVNLEGRLNGMLTAHMAKGGEVEHFGIGGVAKKGLGLLAEALAPAGEAAKVLTAADRAKVGKLAAEATAKQPVTRMSEALGNVGAEGKKKVRVTQTDRTGAKYLGGAPFSMMQEVDPTYKAAQATWGVKTPGAAKNIVNQAGDDILFSTYVGSPTQHRSNELIFDKLYKAFNKSVKEGNLNEELRSKFNNALEPLFGEGADILDPKLRKEIDTFEKRAVVGNLLLGEGLGGALRGGSIIPGGKIMAETTEPMLKDVDTFAVGPRLFTLNKGIVTRPDLHPAFPEILQGEDLKQLFVPVPNEIALPDFNAAFRARTGRKKPGTYDLAMTPPGEPAPTQDITEEYLNFLQREGYAEGGLAHMAEGGAPKHVDPSQLFPINPDIKAPAMARTRAGTPASDASILEPLEALWNTGAGAIKGMTSTALGAPADILNMGKAAQAWLSGKENNPKTDIPYGSEYFKENLPSAGKSHEAGIGEELGGFIPLPSQALTVPAKAIATGAKAVGKVAKASAPYAGKLAQEFAEATQFGLPLQMNVVKPKGGNWLAGSTERLTEPMKTQRIANQTPLERIPLHEELLNDPTLNADQLDRVKYQLGLTKNDAALDKWVDQKLGKYVKNEMGTPEDPIRLGIERRAAEAEKLKEVGEAKLAKMQAGIDKAKAEGKVTTLSENDLAAAKEKLEEEYQIASRGLYHGTVPEGGWDITNIWEPEQVGSKRVREGFPESGFGKHPASIDWELKADTELQNYLAKDLQAEHLKGTPLVEQNPWLSKVDPESKVYKLDGMHPDVGLEFRHMIDEVKDAMDPATNLPKNLRIAPKDLEKMTVDDVSALSGKISAWRDGQKTKSNLDIANNPATHTFKEYPEEINPKGVSWKQIKRPEGLPDEQAEQAVRDATKYEGDVMRHCVGGSGHCEPLLTGETELYTLRDAKGEPHVTIEVGIPQTPYDMHELKKIYSDSELKEIRRDWYNADTKLNDIYDDDMDNALRFAGMEPTKPAILEIKGKNNRKPSDDYIPFVHDFIKSGNWSDVGDLEHTDLIKIANDSYMAIKLRQSGVKKVPNYVTHDEMNVLSRWMAEGGGKSPARGGKPPEGFAKGGAVSNDLESRLNSMLSKHMAEGGQAGGQGLAPYGLRHSGEGAKGKGYFGELPHQSGSPATELSAEHPDIGEYPLIVPTLSHEELQHLLSGKPPTEDIYFKAEEHAERRKKQGKHPFAQPDELRYPLPKKMAEGGAAYNTNPDIADGGMFIQAPAFAIGGRISLTGN